MFFGLDLVMEAPYGVVQINADDNSYYVPMFCCTRLSSKATDLSTYISSLTDQCWMILTSA